MADQTRKSTTGIKEIKEFFEMSTGDFMKDWRQPDAKDREDLRKGILDGSLTY